MFVGAVLSVPTLVLRLLSVALRPFPLGWSLLFTLGPCDDPIFLVVAGMRSLLQARVPAARMISPALRQQTTGRVFHTARALSRQRGGPSISLWVLMTPV
jgi:hypothetical protein